jgi:hypothetical protein
MEYIAKEWKEGNPWIVELLKRREIIITPMTNAQGFDSNIRVKLAFLISS